MTNIDNIWHKWQKRQSRISDELAEVAGHDLMQTYKQLENLASCTNVLIK